MMKPIFLAILVWGCFVASAPRVYACFCVTPDVPEAFKQAKAVFLGEVVEVIEPKNSNESAPIADRLFTIRFKIHRAWKGVAVGSRELNVLAAQGRTECFALPSVRKGERYLVYADPDPKAGNLSHIAVCGRTSAVRFGASPRLLSADAVDPYEDMKQLDAITERTFRFNTARPRRRP